MRRGGGKTPAGRKWAAGYPSARLFVMEGAGHGFYGAARESAAEYILEYLYAHC